MSQHAARGGDEPGAAAADGDTSLGRFAPDPTGAPLAEVRLLGLPVAVMMAAREHYDGLMREFRLLALDGHIAETDAPARLVELVRILGEQYGASRSRRDEIMEAAVARGDVVIDLVDSVPVTAAAAVDGLRGLMEEADRYCQEAVLLTIPREPVVKQYADWYFDEYARQLAGGPPRRWDGPLHV
jgi:hypothetical protein